MKIVTVFPGIGVLPERKNNVSGHVQIPVKTSELMSKFGHDVTIISTAQPDGSAMPAMLPDGMKVKLVADGRRRGQLGKQNARAGYKILSLAKQLFITVSEIRKIDPDVIHVFGFERMVKYSALLKLLTGKPVCVSVLGQKPSSSMKLIYKLPDLMTFLTNSVYQDWKGIRPDSTVIRPGVVRVLEAKKTENPINRVLYWREASRFGGADLCIDVFRELAPLHRNIEFCFALRSNKDEVPGLKELENDNSNVAIYRFPYENGLNLEDLLSTSICAVFPNRQLSIEPQMSVVESLSVGCPVIASDIRSLPELVENGKNGFIVECGNVSQLKAAIATLIEHPESIDYSRDEIIRKFNSKWNWNVYTEELEKLYKSVVPG